MEENQLSIDEILELAPTELGSDSLGFIVNSYFNDTPFLKSEDFESESLDKINEDTILWTGAFNKAFGIEQVKMSLWIIDNLESQIEERYIVAKFSDYYDKPLNIFPIVSELLGLENNQLSISTSTPNQSNQNKSHELTFEDTIYSHIWFSSHQLTSEQIEYLFSDIETSDLNSELEIGFQWRNNINFQMGHGLMHWFDNALFEKLTIKSIYRLRLPANELELRFSIPKDEALINQHEVAGGLSKERSPISLNLDYLSIFFNQLENQLSFSGFGLKGHFNILYHGKSLPNQIDFGGRINTRRGILNLWANNFPTIKELKEVFITKGESKPTFEIPNFGIDALRVNHIELQVDIFNFEVQRANLVLDAHPIIELNDHLSFYPRLSVDIKSPLKKEEREVDWQLQGWILAFEAFFTASYSTKSKLFHFSLNNGELNSNKVLEEMDFPKIKDFEIRIIDLEFTADHSSENWLYTGGITIGNNWDWKLSENGFKMELVGLHGEFQFQNELSYFVLGGQFVIGKLVLDASVSHTKGDGYYLQAILNNIEFKVDEFPSQIGLENHIHGINHEVIEEAQTSLNIPSIIIDQLMVECFIPEDEEESKALSFVTSIRIEHDALPIPLDSIFLQLNWLDTLQWSMLVHFTFEHTLEDDTKTSTELFLRSENSDDLLTFSGSIQHLHINDLLDFIEDRFNVEFKEEIPHFLSQAEIKNLEVTLTKEKKKEEEDEEEKEKEKHGNWIFEFDFDAIIPFDEASNLNELETKLKLKVTKQKGKEDVEEHWVVDFALKEDLTLKNDDRLTLNLTFHHQKGTNHLLVDFTMKEAINASEILRYFIPTLEKIPEITVDLNAIYLAVFRNAIEDTAIRKLLIGASLDATVDLTNVEFLHQLLPNKNLNTGIQDLRLAYANGSWTKEEITALSRFSIEKAHELPFPKVDSGDTIADGFSVSGKLALGDSKKEFYIGSHSNDTSLDTDPSEIGEETETKTKEVKLKSVEEKPNKDKESGISDDNASSSAITKWFKINKKIGPLHIQRAGLQFDYGEMMIWLLLDAGLEIAVLSASLDGFGMGTPLDTILDSDKSIKPSFRLDGVGIDFKKGALEIGGALLFRKVKGDPNAVSFSGMIALQFNELNLSILGSYRSMKDPKTGKPLSPSVLMYGNLNYPIGGPPFFFVEGLAAGLGIHRKVAIPVIDKLADFPLIKTVMHPDKKSGADELTEGITALENAIPVMRDSYFFTAGIKFNTFKLVDSFILLILSLGKEIELDLLGYSELAMPKKEVGIEPMAQVRLLLHAAFRPAAGTLQVEARLDSQHSYLLSKKCRLQGGFAFYAWFKGKRPSGDGGTPGDFVLTLGGYHPHFKVPDHFPEVPRLGFHWEVDKHMHLKGELYFALTPSSLMAGGLLEATWANKHLSASFYLGLNMLINWQPFHYEADLLLNVKASYHGILNFDGELKVQVQIWGPEFGGTASFEILFITVDTSFGAAQLTTPVLLKWEEFVSTLLSIQNNQLFNGRIASGRLLANPEEVQGSGPIHVNPASFELVFESQVPFTSYAINGPDTVEVGKSFGIPAMGKKQVRSSVEIRVEHNGDINKGFEILKTIDKNAPAALWGRNAITNLNDDVLVEGLVFGFHISPGPDSLALNGEGFILSDPINLHNLEIDQKEGGASFDSFITKRNNDLIVNQKEELLQFWE